MEMKDSVSLQKRGAVMEEKTRKPETAKQTAKEHHVPSTKTSTNTATRNLRLRCCLFSSPSFW